MQPFTQGKIYGRLRRNKGHLVHYTRKALRFARAARFPVFAFYFALVFIAVADAAPPEDATGIIGIIAAFAAERDALMINPDATADEYRAMRERFAGRLSLETMTEPELAASAAAGFWDSAENRARASARLFVFPNDALVAAIRLRLEGAMTLDQTPDAGRQRERVAALLSRPDLPELMRSANARYAADALCRVGRSAVLSERGSEIAAAFAALDPAQSPEIAADARRVALMLTLALPAPSPRRAALEKLLIFVRAVKPREPKQKAALERQSQQIEDILRQTTADGIAPGRFTLPTIYDTLRSAAPFSEPLIARSRFYPDEEYLLPLSRDARHPRRDTVSAAREALLPPLGETGARIFGGAAITDSMFGFTARDLGVLPEIGSGFAKNVQFRFGPYDLRADFLRRSDDGTSEIINGGLYALYRGRGWAKAETSRITLTADREINVEGVRLSVLNLRLLTIKHLKTRLPEPTSESASPKTISGPKGQSPVTQLLVLPTVGFETGGLTLGYANAFKFARRLTVPFRFRSYAKDATSADIGLNYNLLKTTNGLDRFTEADYLQENYLGSYYFDALNDAPQEENQRLFVPSLFAGVYTARNQYYVDKDSIRRAIDTPFKAALEMSGGAAGLLGGRLQLSRERVTDEGQGADARWQILGVAGPPTIRIFRGTHLFLRGEGVSRNGEQGTYTWLRGIGGVTTRLTPQVRLSAAYLRSRERGKPRFTYDQVPADAGYAVRGDFFLGNIRFYAMDRYSQTQRRWVRWQIYLSEMVGVLEPYVRVDQRFGSVSVGLRAPVQPLIDQFLRRRYSRIESADAPQSEQAAEKK